MKKIIMAAILMTHATISIADGWSNLHGISKEGNRLLIYPQAYYDGFGVDEGDRFIIVSYKGKSTRPSDITMRYRDQICNLQNDKITYEPSLFSCAASGKSPLSGATYKIVRNKDPKDCSYEYMYICIKGCSNPEALQTITKDYWECME